MSWFDRLGIALAYVLIGLAALLVAFVIWTTWSRP